MLISKNGPLSVRITTFLKTAWEGSQIELSQKFYRKQKVILDGKNHALVNMRLPKGSLVWQGVVIPKLTAVKKA